MDNNGSSLPARVILNPIAGKGRGIERKGEIEKILADHRIPYEMVVTEGVWHAAELAKQACAGGYSAVVAAGGDGTMNEVVNGLMLAAGEGKTLPPMAVMCVGRGNDFAYGADVPVDLNRVCELMASGCRRPMDVGKVTGGYYPEGRYFGNGIGVGFDTIVGLEAAKMTHVHGFMAYVLGALKTFVKFPAPPLVEITWNGETRKLYAAQISLMNGKRMGGTFFMAPESRNDDGMLDICMGDRMTRGQMIKVIAMYTKGTQKATSLITTGRAPEFRIKALEGGLVVHADGETICTEGQELLVECLPRRIEIICETGKTGI